VRGGGEGSFRSGMRRAERVSGAVKPTGVLRGAMLRAFAYGWGSLQVLLFPWRWNRKHPLSARSPSTAKLRGSQTDLMNSPVQRQHRPPERSRRGPHDTCLQAP